MKRATRESVCPLSNILETTFWAGDYLAACQVANAQKNPEAFPRKPSRCWRTTLFFHAKDDQPEVRWKIFQLLASLDAKVIVAFRRKEYLAKTARTLMTRGQKIQPNDIYDDLVKRLFKNLLHKAEENTIVFARRGKSARQHALENAIRRAQHNFKSATGIRSDSRTKIVSASPSEYAGLQIVDYYLWALQRMLERGEDRFFDMLRPAYRLIMDLDDTRNRPYGEWYSDANPLELVKIKPVIG